jgi:hypothetical protein
VPACVTAVEQLSLGRELSAMCWHQRSPPTGSSPRLPSSAASKSWRRRRRRRQPPLRFPYTASTVNGHGAAAPSAPGPAAVAASTALPPYWVCSAAVYSACATSLGGNASRESCESCVASHARAIGAAGCTDPAAARRVCHRNESSCGVAVQGACPGLTGAAAAGCLWAAVLTEIYLRDVSVLARRD